MNTGIPQKNSGLTAPTNAQALVQSPHRTVILGGNGYIGSSLMQAIDAHSIDLCLFGNNRTHSQVENFDTCGLASYETIILLAGHSSVPMCAANPHHAWVNNVDAFYRLCEALTPSQRLIYASSSCVYGVGSTPFTETTMNLTPINHYDLTKITIDLIAARFIHMGKQIIGLRFGTVNGPSPNTRSDLMMNSMMASIRRHGYLVITNDWVKRPILGISDLTRGIQAILAAEQAPAGFYNMASFNTTVRTIAHTLQKATGCGIHHGQDSPSVYDFEICSKKFEDTFAFTFQDTPESITKALQSADLTHGLPRTHDTGFVPSEMRYLP